MTKKDKTTLANVVTDYLQLKALTASQEKQMESLKEVALSIVAKYPDDWADGAFNVEGAGVIKEALNKPKVVYTATGEGLTDIEVIGLISLLGKEYEKPGVNVVKLRDAVNKGDKQVLAVLKKSKVVCMQEKRLDIKKA